MEKEKRFSMTGKKPSGSSSKSLSGSEIREHFLRFFEGKGHTRVASSSLVPQGDPTLLFTNAGMNQFKMVFLGEESRDYTRAVSCQKCVRAGGKHNDLENVGFTARHQTFFEMLGNFSFGDYFKKEAIEYAWEFLTEVLCLDRERLWVSIYSEDEEAFGFWKEIGFPAERIIRLGNLAEGDEENFWSMGETGPCGPCSEIHYDQGPSIGCGNPDCSPACDCDRYLELWNLVFMQYNRTAEGELIPLPSPSIDTGMGLERVAAVIQGKSTNFETDLLFPLVQKVSELSGEEYGRDDRTSAAMRVIADHIRSVGFLIADGVLPSNEGRGYVMRRILRRGVRYARQLGFEEPILFELIPVLVDILGDSYPDLKDQTGHIAKVVRLEEEKFSETLNEGIQLLEKSFQELEKSGETRLSGEIVFRLYDTFGFPADLTALIAKERGREVDMDRFELLLKKNRERSRTSHGKDEFLTGFAWEKGLETTRFTGYEKEEDEGEILFLVREGRDEGMKNLTGEGIVVLDRTPFYAESGGQVSDRGIIEGASGRGRVVEVQKTDRGIFLHKVVVEEGTLNEGDRVRLVIDPLRRSRIRAHHTATHLLQAALKIVVGDHVAQSGSLVDPDRLRFDFSHYQALSDEEIERVEKEVNEWILANVPVVTEVLPREEALKRGALAYFGEKYGVTVRMVSVGNNVSRELCGGTHVRATGEIGSFRVTRETGVASGVRRIEAVAGLAALEYFRDMEQQIFDLEKILQVNREHITVKVEKLVARIKSLENDLRNLNRKLIDSESKGGSSPVREYRLNGGGKLVTAVFQGMKSGEISDLADKLCSDPKLNTVAVLFSDLGKKCLAVIKVSSTLLEKYDARKLFELVRDRISGGGGGRPDFVQAGGRNPSGIPDAISILVSELSEED